jgi:hypothetical protein
VADGEDHATGLYDADKFFCLRVVEGERFVADDVEASLSGRFGDLEVGMVRSGDADKVDPLIGGE